MPMLSLTDPTLNDVERACAVFLRDYGRNAIAAAEVLLDALEPISDACPVLKGRMMRTMLYPDGGQLTVIRKVCRRVLNEERAAVFDLVRHADALLNTGWPARRREAEQAADMLVAAFDYNPERLRLFFKLVSGTRFGFELVEHCARATMGLPETWEDR